MFRRCTRLIKKTLLGSNKKVKYCSVLNNEVCTNVLGDCTAHSRGYCNHFKKETKHI